MGFQNLPVWFLWFQSGARGPGLRLVPVSIEETLTEMPYAVFGAKTPLDLPPQSGTLSCCDSSRATRVKSASLKWTLDVGLLLGTEAWHIVRLEERYCLGRLPIHPPWPAFLFLGPDTCKWPLI